MAFATAVLGNGFATLRYLLIQWFCYAKEVWEEAQRPSSTNIILNILVTSKLIIDRATLHFNVQDGDIKNKRSYSLKIAK